MTPPAPARPAVLVAPSAINGLGVFAAAAFSAGGIILPLDDSRVVDAQHPVPPGEEHHCDYLEAGRVVWMPSPECYINHSCDPNTFVRTTAGVRYVIALRPIAAAEEITYDYCINSSGDVVWQCHCGAARCRRAIHSDFFHLPLDLQREYLPLLDHWFRKERASDLARLEATLAAHPPQY